MNQMVLDTFVYVNPDTGDNNLLRFETPVKLLHGWYGNNIEDLVFSDLVDDETSLDLLLHVITTLPDNLFDGSYIQQGWEAQEDLYHRVFARNCRLCHVQIASNSDSTKLDLNFDTYDEFIANGNLVNHVFERGIMPLSRLTYDRFWVDFYGETGAAEILRDHLNEADIDVADVSPGVPVANLTPADSDPEPDISMDFDELQLFDGSGSLFADVYQWTLDSSPFTGSDGNPVTTAAVTFPVDGLSLQPGETYDIGMIVSDEALSVSSAEEVRSIQINDNPPAAGETITVNVNEGLWIDIDLFEELCPGLSEDNEGCRRFFGDISPGDIPGLIVHDEENGTLDTGDVENGLVTFTSTESVSAGNGGFQFTLVDSFNEASSSPGEVIVEVNPLEAPTVGNDTCTVEALASGECSGLLENDSVADDRLTLRIISVDSENEAVSLDGGIITYTAPRFLAGSNIDNFEYTVQDDSVNQKTATGTVTVSITPTVTYTSLVGTELSGCLAGGCHDGTSGRPNYNNASELTLVAINTNRGFDGGSGYGDPEIDLEPGPGNTTTDARLLQAILFQYACTSSGSGGHTGGNVLCEAVDTDISDDRELSDLNADGRELLRWVQEGARDN